MTTRSAFPRLLRGLVLALAGLVAASLTGCDAAPEAPRDPDTQEAPSEDAEDALGESAAPLEQRRSPLDMSPPGDLDSPERDPLADELDGGFGPGLPGGDRTEPDPLPWKLPLPHASANDA